MADLADATNDEEKEDDAAYQDSYDIYWICVAEPTISDGVYTTYTALRPYLLPKMNPPPAASDFPLDHITFLGIGTTQRHNKQVRHSELNAIAHRYDLETLLTLFDLDSHRIVPDVPLTTPTLGWLPIHAQTITSKTTLDYHLARHHHGIAALAPSGAQKLHDSVGTTKEIHLSNTKTQAYSAPIFSSTVVNPTTGKKRQFIDVMSKRQDKDVLQLIQNYYGTVPVDCIGHIIDRQKLVQQAQLGLQYIQQLPSIAHVDAYFINTNTDTNTSMPPILNRGQETTLELGHPNHSLFSRLDPRTAQPNTDFLVLLHGGNYDAADRKGWDTSIQAFVQFYNQYVNVGLDDNNNTTHNNDNNNNNSYNHSSSNNSKNGRPRPRVHLLLHSMESYLLASDSNGDEDPPAALLPQGYHLRKALHEAKIPRDVYTIDIARHTPEVIAAYKLRASVCLHPSKVEGFGMILVECQALGTPVITTKYTAMDDYTKLGRSVPSKQTIQTPNALFSMALPDVAGIVTALGELYYEHNMIHNDASITNTNTNTNTVTNSDIVRRRRKQEIEQTYQWIDTSFSSQTIGTAFRSLIRRAHQEYTKRRKAETQLRSMLEYGDGEHVRPSPILTFGAYKVVTGYHLSIVDWDEPWTLIAPEGLKILDPDQLHGLCWSMLFMDGRDDDTMNTNGAGTTDGSSTAPVVVLALPAVYDDGGDRHRRPLSPVPFTNNIDGSIHDDLPILVRTWIVTEVQSRASRQKSVRALVMKHSTNTQPKILPKGLAVVVRN